MFAASALPSAAPAPMMVCSSSINRMMFLLFFTSSIAFLIRSSNSPRYLVPATMPVRSSATTRLSRRCSGTSPLAIFSARPSAIAVLPTPGSPIRQGLFLVRRERIWMIRRISSSLPMTGSISPFFAALVRSREKLSSALLPPSADEAPLFSKPFCCSFSRFALIWSAIV